MSKTIDALEARCTVLERERDEWQRRSDDCDRQLKIMRGDLEYIRAQLWKRE